MAARGRWRHQPGRGIVVSIVDPSQGAAQCPPERVARSLSGWSITEWLFRVTQWPSFCR